jgi:hypothetical protein
MAQVMVNISFTAASAAEANAAIAALNAPVGAQVNAQITDTLVSGVVDDGGNVAEPAPDAPPPAETPPEQQVEPVPDGTIDEVMAWVGTDPARARQALDAENAKPSPRSTLVSQLEPLAA